MIDIQYKKDCCGCSACASVCPKQCIIMVRDKEGFLYPKVDEETCVNCGLCEKVCNERHPYDRREPLQVLAAINKNENVRLRSSSGGIFYILAENVIKDDGVVFGARFDKNWQVVIDYAEEMKGVESFMGSKYVQARVSNAYKDVKRFLAEGRKVLFSGTPCQVAGLHKYLRKQYENLLTVDFICHGTPSPKVWGMYLDEVIEEVKRISDAELRDKRNGCKNYSFNLRYNDNDKTITMLSSSSQNHYMRAFLQDIILRPSCYDCNAKGFSSQSDITIADFWGIETVFPDMDDDKGTGLVFINTEKGKKVLDPKRMSVRETTYERIKPLNPSCYRSSKVHPKRAEFFERLEGENLIDLINDCAKPTPKQMLLVLIGRCKRIVKILLKLVGGKPERLRINEPIKGKNTIKLPENPRIVSVCFRCKNSGWKKYNLEIRVR